MAPPPKRERSVAAVVIRSCLRKAYSDLGWPALAIVARQTQPLAYKVAADAPIVTGMAEHDEPIRREGRQAHAQAAVLPAVARPGRNDL
jgi:hypothetical protein